MTSQPFSDDSTTSVSKDFASDSPHLLVAFGGIYGGLGIPPFEFFNLTKGADVKKLYIRDLDQCLYHRGLRGMSTDIPSTAEVIRELLVESKAKTITFTGNSQGGYASLLFGSLLDVNYTHAFSPQAFITYADRLRARDNRWQMIVLRIHLQSLFKPKFFNLRRALSPLQYKTQHNIYFGLEEPLDKFHAEYLQGLPGMNLHSYPMDKKRLMKHLRDSGDLSEILFGYVNQK